MSVEPLRIIARDLEARADTVGSLDEGLAILSETTRTLACHMAELVHLKVLTEPGWKPDEARKLAERALDSHARVIAETVHEHGGAMELAVHLGEVVFDAFRDRLAELHANQGAGSIA